MPCSLVGVCGYSIMYPTAGGRGYTDICQPLWHQITKDYSVHSLKSHITICICRPLLYSMVSTFKGMVQQP